MARVITNDEEREHVALASWLDARSVLWCHASPNAYRAALARTGRPPWDAARKARAMGVKSGVPDVLIFTLSRHAGQPTAIELKRRKESGDSKLSAEQKGWLKALKTCGWHVNVCYGCADAMQYLLKLGY
jgi:hypothetical protein